MKLKKVLASILAICMVLGTMSFTVFAEATVYNVSNDAELADAISKAVDGDTIKLAEGKYTGGISIGTDITLEGAVDEDGNPTTVFSGENPSTGGSNWYYSIHMNKGTIKNIKIIDAWKGIMTEGKGSLTIDNVTMVKIGYGIHIAETKNAEDTVTITNCHLDITWANSFAAGEYKIIMKNNVFTAEEPHYGADSTANAVNTYNPNTIISENIFEEKTKILIREEAKDGVEIGPNYYEDGFENALNDGGAKGVVIETYYPSREMKEAKITPKGTLNSCKVNDKDENRTFITTELNTVYAEESIKLEILDADGNVLATTLSTDKVFEDITFPIGAFSIFTGINSTDDYWTTTWASQKLRGDIEPNKAVLYVDDIKTSEIDFAMKSAISNKDIVWSEVSGVFNPNINGAYLGGSYDNAYLCVEVYDFYLGETFEVKYFSNGEHIATASLKEGMLPSGARGSIGCCLGFNGDFDEYWKTEWRVPANAEQIPDKVEVYVDGVKIAEKEGSFGNFVKGWESIGNKLYDLIAEDWIKINGVHTVAKVGEKGYATIQAAVDAAVAGENEIIILPGTYDETFIVNQKEGVNVTIKAENKGDVVLTEQVKVCGNGRSNGTDTLTFENLVFDASDKASGFDCILDDKGSGNYSYLHNMTVRNCDFIGNGQGNVAPVVGFRARTGGAYNTVFENCTAKDMFSFVDAKGSSNINITDSTFTNMSEGVFNAHHTKTIVFNNNFVEAVEYAVRSGQTNNDDYDTPQITMNGNTIYAKTALALRNVIAVAEMKSNSIVADNAFTNDDADDSTINGVAITADDIVEKIGENNIIIPTEIKVGFEEVTPGTYEIVLTAADDIYEFVSAELAFLNNSTTLTNQPMGYEIVPEANIIVNENIANKGTFNFNIKPNADGVTVDRIISSKIVLGKVVFPANGKYDFKVDAANSKVVTTKYNTNDEEEYTANGTLKLIADATGISSEVKAATRDVAVNVNFVHDITDGAENFKVTLRDADGNTTEQMLEIANNTGITTFPGVEIGNVTVTLEAEGFRKFTYRTTLEKGEGAVVLNFWNDWKRGTTEDPKLEIEAGKGEVEKNFIAGDIAMDYIVDKYDLAAVTSYYGTYGYTNANFVKYDLNRDGKIDIDDVAYVLHNFGK